MDENDISAFKKRRFWKVMFEDEKHNGFQYHDGLNVDILPFKPKGYCEPGGLYFTDIKYVLEYLSYSTRRAHHFREIFIPDNALIYQDGGSKWKADRIFLGKKHPFNLKTILYLEKWGSFLSISWGDILTVAAAQNKVKIIKYYIGRAGLSLQSIIQLKELAGAYHKHRVVYFLRRYFKKRTKMIRLKYG